MRALCGCRVTGGFSLVELLVVLGLAALLVMLAGPSTLGTLQRVRRADAWAALQRLQGAQERFRAEHPRYAGLAELGLAAQSPQGHYTLAVQAPSPTGYEAHAEALGVQTDDAACRHLHLIVSGPAVHRRSGPAADAGNTEAANRRCWGD